MGVFPCRGEVAPCQRAPGSIRRVAVDVNMADGSVACWDVTADGQRFLINTVIGDADPSTLNVVLNWQSGLSR